MTNREGKSTVKITRIAKGRAIWNVTSERTLGAVHLGQVVAREPDLKDGSMFAFVLEEGARLTTADMLAVANFLNCLEYDVTSPNPEKSSRGFLYEDGEFGAGCRIGYRRLSGRQFDTASYETL